MSKRLVVVGAVVVLIVGLLLAWFVWPTPWSYRAMTVRTADRPDVPVLFRTHRLTGAVEWRLMWEPTWLVGDPVAFVVHENAFTHDLPGSGR